MTHSWDPTPISTDGHLSFNDLKAAMERMREESYEPTMMVVSPATYRSFDWYLRKTKITTRYVLFPWMDRLAKRVRRARRVVTNARWDIEDYGVRDGLREAWREWRGVYR